jgi:hypothetical protein
MSALSTIRRSSGTLIVLGAAAVAALSSAPGAAASQGFQTATATKKVSGPPGSTGSVTAHCPTGTHVLSGGYDSTFSNGPHGSGVGLLPHASRRVGPRAWRVSAYKVGDRNDTVELTAVARCGSGVGHLESSTAKIAVPSPRGNLGLRTASAHCPAGRYPVSGGFRMSINGRTGAGPNSPPIAIVLGSRSTGRSWAVTAARLVQTGESQLTSYAYCGTDRPVTRAKSAIFRSGNLPHHLTTSPCPWGTLAVGGGFLAHFPMGPAPGVMLPITSSLGGPRRWTLTGLANGRSFVSAYVYCLAPPLPAG